MAGRLPSDCAGDSQGGATRRSPNALDGKIKTLRVQEASLRESYEAYSATRVGVVKLIELFDRRAKLAARRAEIAAAPARREGEVQPVGPDSTALFDFGETVKAVLTAWNVGADRKLSHF